MKQKDILVIFILLFVFVVTWIVSSIYHNSVQSTISETLNQDISQINPTFDVKTINKLKNRQRLNPLLELENITPTPTPLPPNILNPQDSTQGGKLLL